MKDPYSVLGVSRDADSEDVKEAYREKAKKHHPDRGGDEEKFKEVQDAYEKIREGGVGHNDFGSTRSNPGVSYGGEKTVEEFIRDFRKWSSASSIFDEERSKGKATAHIDFETAVHGEDNVNVGMTTIDIPPGIQDGTQLFFPEANSKIKFKVGNATDYWRKNKNDIYTKRRIPVWDAMTGTELEIETLDGRTVRTEVGPGTKDEALFRFPGMGGPETFSGKPEGDFYVKLNVDIPEVTDPELVEKLTRIKNSLK